MSLKTASKIHLCFVGYEYSDQFSSASALLDDYFSLTDIAEALSAEGCRVSAVIRFKRDLQLHRNGVDYYFVADTYGPQLKFWQIPRRVHQQVCRLLPMIVHTHNMNKVIQHNHLVDLLGSKIPLLVQNHAEWPAKWLRIAVQRWVFAKLSAFIFCAHGQELAWHRQQIIQKEQAIYYVMEGSTKFEYHRRAMARRRTLLEGKPVFLWVGNLNENKDPLCVLGAFECLLADYPKARMYMLYRFDDLLAEVQAFIRASDVLSASVTLLGKRSRAELEDYYNSADYFVLGSHQEGSGYSLMEALACGCVPIVTDIPSFRMMTKEGQIGALWKCGDAEDALSAMKAALCENWKLASQQARLHFEQQLSNPAIARQLKAIYIELVFGQKSTTLL